LPALLKVAVCDVCEDDISKIAGQNCPCCSASYYKFTGLSMRILFLFILSFLTHDFVQAQVQINGFVFNLATGTAIEHATIELTGKKTYRTLSDSSGAFILRPGFQEIYTLKVTHVSCTTLEEVLAVQKDTVLYLYLQPANSSLDEVKVTAQNIRHYSANIQLSQNDILQQGSALGDANVYEALQKQAGVIHTNELNTGLYVRGLGTGNTGMLIDGFNSFSGNHVLGIYPIVNANAYKNVRLLKEDIHPQYSGYLSSYLLLETDNHISDSVKSNAELGILTSKLGLQLPLVKNKVGLISNIRRSYFDIISNTYNSIYKDKKDYSPLPSYSFWDWNNTLIINKGNRGLVKLNSFYSSDKFKMSNDNLALNLDWKNWSISANWEYAISKYKQLKINVGHASYIANMDYTSLMKQMHNKISESSVQANLYWQASDQFALDYGIYAKYSTLTMNSWSQTDVDAPDGNINMHEVNAQNAGAYIYSNLALNSVVKVKLGSKIEYYRADKPYVTFSPTVSAVFNGPKQGLLVNLSRRVQFSHLYVPMGVQLPMNVWYPSTRQTPPENAWHFTTTYSRMLNSQLKWSLSAYYILLRNQIEFLDKNYFTSLDFKTIIGKGTSKGLELNLMYNTKKVQVESHYTLGKSTCQFPDINNGKEYSLPYDIRHKIDLLFSWQLSPKWSFSFAQFIQSGFLITIPTGFYLHQNADGIVSNMREVPIYKDRNNLRMPLSHRMDISVKHTFKFRNLKCSWTAGTYNTYAYQNPYFIYFKEVKDVQGNSFLRARKKSILPLVRFFSNHTEL
jgi:hypothetical protein